MKKRLIKLLIIIIIYYLNLANIFACIIDNSTITFEDGMDVRSPLNIQMRSINRDNCGNDVFGYIQSKYNQPRSIGTTPHRGTDIEMNWLSDNDFVYSVNPGTVRRNEGYSLSVEIQNKLFASFFHVIGYTLKDDVVTVNEKIARVGFEYENG
jgi:preprotein translocase subunit SecF